MEKLYQFGDYVKDLRKRKDMTMDTLSKKLGISLTLLSDIENGRRMPFEKERMESFAHILELNDTEKARLYDLAAQRKKSVPEDVVDTIMYNPDVSNLVRLALRKTNSGEIPKEAWEEFVRNNGCEEDNDA